MAKQSALDRAIANLTQQIEALELAKRHLLEQQKSAVKTPAKPRVVPREEKSAS